MFPSVRSAVALMVVLGGGCVLEESEPQGPTPQEFCDELASGLCSRMFACFSPTDITEPECVTDLRDAFECDLFTEQNVCGLGERYRPADAASCSQQTSTASCDSLASYIDQAITLEQLSPACGSVCR